MSVSPSDLLNSAKLVRSQQADEAGHRATVSRSYYAAYHAAKTFHELLPTPGSVGAKAGAHEQLASQLTNPSIPKADSRHQLSRKLGIMLVDLLRDRVVADYFVSQTMSDADADAALQKAQKILGLAH